MVRRPWGSSRLRVWRGTINVNGEQLEALISSHTIKKAYQTLNISQIRFRHHWRESTDPEHRAVAERAVDTVWVNDKLNGKAYIPLQQLLHPALEE